MNNNLELIPATIFIDLDGTIIKHDGLHDLNEQPILLPGVREKFHEWISKSCKIIITTGRRESLRNLTIKQLEFLSLPYDQLIMDVGRGKRVIINDLKITLEDEGVTYSCTHLAGMEREELKQLQTAQAICTFRNEGLQDINI